MKKYILIIILLMNSSILLKSQDSIPFSKEDIVGRWVEARRIVGDREEVIGEFPDTYIFRDNMVFHKGESAEGVIVFNVTGKYTVGGDSVSIYYNNYLLNAVQRQKPKKMLFRILSLSEDEMLVQVTDYDYEYKMILKRTDI